MPQQIDILLNVADVDRSLAFYRDLIGLELSGSWVDDDGNTRWARLTVPGGASLMLNRPEGPPLTDRPCRPSYRDAVIYVKLAHLAELQAVHQRLSAAGATPGPTSDESYGQREFIVRDPDGYDVACAAELDR